MDTDMEIDSEDLIDISKLNLETNNEVTEEESADDDDDYMAIFLADMYMSNPDETPKQETLREQMNVHNDAINNNLNQDFWENNIMETEPPAEIPDQTPSPDPPTPQENLSPEVNEITEQFENIAVQNAGPEENEEICDKLFEEMTNYIVKYIRYDQECLASLINDIIWEHMPPYLLLKINKSVFKRLVEFARFAKDPEATTRFHA